jgi:peptidoglycan/LPS O-acetylase OafA/YrhL
MPARIGPLWALLIGFVVLMASNSWLKGIFGVGEIATDVPFLLTGLVLFGIWKFNRRGGSRNTLMGSAIAATSRSWKARVISSSADRAVTTSCYAMTARRIC